MVVAAWWGYSKRNIHVYMYTDMYIYMYMCISIYLSIYTLYVHTGRKDDAN